MMLNAIHITDIKDASHKSWLKILIYHHFVTLAPSDLTNRAYLRAKNLIIIAIEMHKQNLINHYFSRILKNIVSGSSAIMLLKLNETRLRYLLFYDSILAYVSYA